MGLKVDEFSDESCRRDAGIQYSSNDGDGVRICANSKDRGDGARSPKTHSPCSDFGPPSNLVLPDDEAELNTLEHTLQSPSGDESDPDLVEHDVKVCDICGDAGREDLLAVCSRCSDGAEHTYCMQVKLEEVPKDEWFCDECKLEEETERRKNCNAEILNKNEEKKSRERTDLFVKLDKSDLYEVNRTNKVKPSTNFSRLRPLKNIDVDSDVKRQALDTSAGSSSVSSPSRRNAPSPDSAFKNLDKGKVKLAHQMSFSTSSSPRFQNIKGNILKSNSFNSISNNPRVKPADEDIPRKQKGYGEVSSCALKEGPLKMLSKSSSFKSANSSRSSAPESKVKMLSPAFQHFQDIKGPRKARERNTFERKNLSKLDVPMVGLGKSISTVSALKGDQKLTHRGESTLQTSASNTKDLNPVQSEGKSNCSKSIGSMARKALEISVEENGRTVSLTAVGASSNNGISSSDEQRNLVSPKIESSATSYQITERPSIPANVVDPSGTDSGNNLKAAIHAAMLKKPGIYKKRKLPDQSDELSLSSTDFNCRIASQEQLSISRDFKSMSAAKQEGSSIFLGNSFSANISSEEKPSVKDFPSSATMMSVNLQKSAIPEHVHIWQGDFEVLRNGKGQELCGGIQAHLSTCASPRVLDVVNKFAYRVHLTEVSRLSTWPAQFHDCGPTENHIALFFFAKDVVSYERNYRSLLERMMKNDIALKGSIDGVELLIFPSNQLPRKFQRWNMLFFLWGVFRASKLNCLGTNPDSSKKLNGSDLKAISLDAHTSSADISRSENLCLARRIDKESPLCDTTTVAVISQEAIGGEDRLLPLSPIKTHSLNSQREDSIARVSLKNEKSVDDEEMSDLQSLPDINTITRDSSMKDPSEHPHIDLEGTTFSFSCTNAEQITKNLNIESNGVHASDSRINNNGARGDFFLETLGKQKCYKAMDVVQITEDPGYPERHFFPVVPHRVNELRVGDDEGWLQPGVSNRHRDNIPNLNLALGDEQDQVMLPFFVGGSVEKKNDQEFEKLTDSSSMIEKEGNDVTGSLSLSLSFPFT